MTETRHLKKYCYFFQVAIAIILSFTQFMPMYMPIGLGNAPDQVWTSTTTVNSIFAVKFAERSNRSFPVYFMNHVREHLFSLIL